MNFIKRAGLKYLSRTIEKSLPHATDEELHLQWERVQLNIRDATDPEAEIIYIGISGMISSEMVRRGLV